MANPFTEKELNQLSSELFKKFLGQLLLFCTESQQQFFHTIYSNGVNEDQLNDARKLVYRTLTSNKIKQESLEKEVKELKQQVIDLQAENNQLQYNLDECKNPKESQDYQDICSSNEELELTLNQYKRDSLKLQALMDAGVDAWDGYDDAIAGLDDDD